MLQTIVEPQPQISGQIRRPQRAQRRQRHRRKIRRALLAKHLIQLRRGQHQHLRHLADARPLIVAVDRRRQRANFHQDLARARMTIEFLQQIQHRRLVGTPRRETLVLGEPLAKLALRGQQQLRDAAPPCEIRGIGPQRRAVRGASRQLRP